MADQVRRNAAKRVPPADSTSTSRPDGAGRSRKSIGSAARGDGAGAKKATKQGKLKSKPPGRKGR